MNISFNWLSTIFQMSNAFIIPSHLKETIRYKQYRLNKRGDLQAMAQELVEGANDRFAFLDYPLEPKSPKKLQKEKVDSDVFA